MLTDKSGYWGPPLTYKTSSKNKLREVLNCAGRIRAARLLYASLPILQEMYADREVVMEAVRHSSCNAKGNVTSA